MTTPTLNNIDTTTAIKNFPAIYNQNNSSLITYITELQAAVMAKTDLSQLTADYVSRINSLITSVNTTLAAQTARINELETEITNLTSRIRTLERIHNEDSDSDSDN